jgi:tetratricopeptide (TPR) repeat protein
MANGKRTDPRKKFTPRFLPWLLAVAAFVVYWLTLNRWVSPENLDMVTKISGWTWLPEFLSPLLYLATYPFHWLPVSQIPIALNLFSTVCAALTLGLLARSVAILPHDRTEAQRERERSVFSFLTIWSAWLPPVLAVAVCGLQLTFWEQATNCTGEMFELLLFAFVIWSLLEYRLDEGEWRLFLAAAVFGAGMADNWAMIGFFPVFVTAIIWTRQLSFFNLRFLRRMLLCGLAGMLFYFLLPLLAVASHKIPITFWAALKLNLQMQWQMVRLIFISSDVRHTIGLLSLTSLLPVALIGIRWTSSFGDSSQIGIALATFLFHIIHAVILGACIWVAFDPPFSPRHLGYGVPFLTFYYLAALSIGYFIGYFLLVFGKQAVDARSQRPKSSPFDFLNIPTICIIWLLAVLSISGLIYKNAPQIRETNGDTFEKFASLTEENLPRSGGLLLSDDPQRLFITEAALARDGRAKDFVPLDTHSLPYPDYERFLHREFPKKWPEIASATQTNTLNPLGILVTLATLAKSNEVYYLHPSYGYYFEEFYLEPHGLVYKLKTLPDGALLPPPLDKNLIAENENFWAKAEKTALAPIENILSPPESETPPAFAEKLLAQLYISNETNQNTVLAGTFYSRSLDFWGVQLQRADDLTNAATRFETALKLNPDNVIVRINLAFNKNLQEGRPQDGVELTEEMSDQLNKRNATLNQDGPLDEPILCLDEGYNLIQNHYLRQAAVPLERVRQLVPDNLAARLLLAQVYLASRLPDLALDALRDPLEQPAKFSLGPNNSTEMNLLASAAYFGETNVARASQLLELEISRNPTNDDLLTAAAQAYMMRGLFTNALAVIDHKLKFAPDDPGWLFSRGYVFMQMKNYDAAIADLNRVLSTQTNNNSALFNRAVAYLDSDKLDEARADYLKLQREFTNSFQIAYGLGEIAWRKHETNEAVRNYGIYLANANTNTAEATNILQRLRELKK